MSDEKVHLCLGFAAGDVFDAEGCDYREHTRAEDQHSIWLATPAPTPHFFKMLGEEFLPGYAVFRKILSCFALPLAACAGNTASTTSAADSRPYSRNPALESRAITTESNPILSSGADYTTDPAPFVAGGNLYILTGRDTARPGVNDFMMPEWQMLESRGDPMLGKWTHYPHFLKPDSVFKWATPGRAYAAQIVRGVDGRFYKYAPVVQAVTQNRDKFAIGVAVSHAPTGRWSDAHPTGPIVSQSYPVANTIQNIDPTVLVDDDKSVFVRIGARLAN